MAQAVLVGGGYPGDPLGSTAFNPNQVHTSINGNAYNAAGDLLGLAGPANSRGINTPGSIYTPISTSNGGGNTAHHSGGGGVGGGTPNPMDSLTSTASDTIGQLNNIYNQLYGNINSDTTQQRSSLEQNYNNQKQTLGDQYIQTARGVQGANMARGLGDSSYAFNDQQSANNLYNDSLTGINADQAGKYDQLAKAQAGAQAGYKSFQDYINNTDWKKLYAGNPYGLSSFVGNLQNNLQQAQQANAQYGVGGDYMKTLNAIAPSQNTGAAQLQKQLADLTQSSVPGFAKDQIASGIINNNVPNDQNSYWLNYYQNLNKQS